MRGVDLSGRARLLTIAAAMVVGALLGQTVPVLAHHECEGVPNCTSISSGPLEIHRSGSVSRVLTCSHGSYAWHAAWDKSSRSDTVVAYQPLAPVGASFEATNWSPSTRHTVTFYLRCAPTPLPSS